MRKLGGNIMFKAISIGLAVTILSNKTICEIVVSTGIVLRLLKVKAGTQIAVSATVVFILVTMIKAII